MLFTRCLFQFKLFQFQAPNPKPALQKGQVAVVFLERVGGNEGCKRGLGSIVPLK